MFIQIVKAVKYLHINNVYHQDLSLTSILVDLNGNVKIVGFGDCVVSPDSDMRSQCEAQDVLFMGVCLYAMLEGEFPFGDNNYSDPRAEFTVPEGWCPDLVALMKTLLTQDPASHSTVEKILT